jgi:protein tyrosine/serine phosphatase
MKNEELRMKVRMKQGLYRQFGFCLLLGCLVTLSTYGQEVTAEKVHLANCGLENLYKIDEGVYRSEQPTAADFRALQKFGIKEVLNLRYWHSDDDEAQGTGLRLYRIKMRAATLELGQLVEALRIIKKRQGPILFHCHHGSDRTGALCALYRIVVQGVSKEAAIREMTEGGFGFHGIYRNIIRLIEKVDVAEVRAAL